MTKPVATEVDLDELLQLAEDGYGTRRVYESVLQALIAETRALRAANRPHIGSCGGCFFAEVELLAALKDGAKAGEPAEKLLRRVLDVLRDEAHRPACATKLPPVGVVTRELIEPDEVCYCPRWCELHSAGNYPAPRNRAAAKPPAGAEVTEALAALDELPAWLDKFAEVHTASRLATIRSALEKCR